MGPTTRSEVIHNTYKPLSLLESDESGGLVLKLVLPTDKGGQIQNTSCRYWRSCFFSSLES